VDNKGTILESNETNNKLSQPLAVTQSVDTTSPSAPANLHITSSDRRSVSLSWSASTDNVGVTGYYIYRSGSSDPIALITGTSYTDRAVTPNKNYTYYVTAIDAQYNEGPASNTVTGRTGK
jgi:fibronectin type 3 domain-containing protein